MKEGRAAKMRVEDGDLRALVARLESAPPRGSGSDPVRARGDRRRAKAAALAPATHGAAHLAPVFLAIGAAGLGAFLLILLRGIVG